MPNNYIAPYLISNEASAVPDGMFTVPICTTPERFDKIMNALWGWGALQGDEFDFDHLVDWLDALPRIVDGCVSIASSCRTFAPTSDLLTWFPENPFTPDEEVPAGYPAHPFTVVNTDNLAGWIVAYGLGYAVGDVFVDLTKLPVFTSWEDLFENYGNMPAFEVTVEGAGTAKAHLLSIPFGGRILVVVDDVIDLLNLKAVELDRSSSFPPESIIELIIETEITTEGTHTIRYVWYPTVSAELVPFAFGGGLRSIELCGFGVTPMDDPCCPDSVEAQQRTNELLTKIYNMIGDGFKIVPLTANTAPDFWIDDDCAPPKFDQDPDDDEPTAALREAALCYTIELYLFHVMYKSLFEAHVPLEFLESILPTETANLPALQRLEVVWWEHFSVSDMLVGLGLSNQLDTIKCHMLANLIGKTNTLKHFQDSVVISDEISGDSGAIDQWQAVFAFNQRYANWKAFSQALEQAIDYEDLAEHDCDCESVTDPLVLIDPNSPEFHNTTIVPLGSDLFQVTQDVELTPGNYPVTLQDHLCRQINVISVGTQPNSHWYNRGDDCTTIEDDGTGGFSGNTYQIGLDYVDPLDSIFMIVLV